MLDFLLKYQEELFIEKRRKDQEIKELELYQKEIEAVIRDVASKTDVAFASLSPLDVSHQDQKKIEELTAKLTQTSDDLSGKVEELQTLANRITKVQNLLNQMSDWRNESGINITESEASGKENYSPDNASKNGSSKNVDLVEIDFQEQLNVDQLIHRLQVIRKHMNSNPKLAKTDLDRLIRELNEHS